MKSTTTLMTMICLMVIQNLLSQSVSLPKSVYAPGEKIVVTFSGFPGQANDWIGISSKGMAEDKYIIWQYLGSRQSGTISFDGQQSGEYEVRGYFNNGGEVKARFSFRVGNTDQNVMAKTEKPTYKPWEKIKITWSGLPGNAKDWVSYAKVGMPDDGYTRWAYTDGKQSGTIELDGIEEGQYEVRVYFSNEGKPQYRYPFKVCTNCGAGKKACRTELSTFYQSMNALGLSWGRLGSDAFVPAMITAVQAELANVPAGINAIGCLDFDVSKVSSFSGRLPGMNRNTAVAEIDAMIKEIQASVMRARVTCDRGALLESLFSTGIHLGAAQAIASTFMCMTIPPDWQGNMRNHLNLASSGISGFGPCISGVNAATAANVPVGAPNAYEPFSIIAGLHMQVLWAVTLSDCCCSCP